MNMPRAPTHVTSELRCIGERGREEGRKEGRQPADEKRQGRVSLIQLVYHSPDF